MNQEPTVEINRPLTGFLALVCLTGAAVVWGFGLEEGQSPLWTAGFMRVGLLMSAFWLALPTQDRPAAWANVSRTTFIGLIVSLFAMFRFPKVAFGMIAVLGAMHFFVRPRVKKRRSIT